MNYTPEYLERRRRSQVRRRRYALAAIVGLLACVAAATAAVYTLNRKKVRVVVVSVNRPAATARTSTSNGFTPSPGAAPTNVVRKELAQAQKHSSSPTAPSSGGQPLGADAESSFSQVAQQAGGNIELAVMPLGGGPMQILGGDEPAHAWSTSKVPVLVSLILARGGSLTPQEQSLAHSAITESSNEAVLALFSDLEGLKGGLDGASAYITGVLQKAGDTETEVATAPPPPGAVTTFGQTEWKPSEAVRFFSALASEKLLGHEETHYVLGLMQEIVPSERWGLGSLSSVAFKGGWGPENGGYLVRQSGIINPGSPDAVVVAIVDSASSFSAGTEALGRISTWLAQHLAHSHGGQG
jgi:VirB8 protein